MESECIRCGKCCEVIYINTSVSAIEKARLRGNSPEMTFISQFFKPLSIKQARRINRAYVDRLLPRVLKGDKFIGMLFTCKKFNRRERACRVHNHKYQICAGYPYYSADVLPARFLGVWDGCGYLRNGT